MFSVRRLKARRQKAPDYTETNDAAQEQSRTFFRFRRAFFLLIGKALVYYQDHLRRNRRAARLHARSGCAPYPFIPLEKELDTKMAISIKTPEDIAGLRLAGRLASELLDYLTPFVKPGVTTGELDKLAYDYTVNVQKCIPACLGYTPPGMTPYPATTCISINHVVCHGIPGPKKLKAGDIVNIDVTSIKNGYHGDTSRMFVIGKPTIAGKRLADLAFQTMWAGIDAVRPGGCFNDIGIACQAFADKNGISVVRDYGGHGIGRGFHEEPHVNHFPVHRETPVFEPGMVFTVEPMVNAGRYGVTMLGDGWTVVTKDRSLSAQWEHMVLVTETGYDILTCSAGTQEPPEFVKGWKKPAF